MIECASDEGVPGTPERGRYSKSSAQRTPLVGAPERSGSRLQDERGWNREENIPTEESPSQANPWLLGPNADPTGPRRDLPPSKQGPQATFRVTRGDVPEQVAGEAGGRRESFPRDARLRQGRDFKRCYRRGRRRIGDHLILYYSPNGLALPRFGTTLSRKVGNSVVRHLIKRRLREIFRRSELRSSLPPVDLVAHVKPGASGVSFAELRLELESLLGTVRNDRQRRDGSMKRTR